MTLRLAALVLLAGSVPTVAEPPVPAELQVTITARVLAYDRAFKSHAGQALGVLFKASDRSSADAAAEVVEAFRAAAEGNGAESAFRRAESHRYKDPADLSAWIVAQEIRVLYVAPGLANELDAVREIARDRRVVTVTSVRSFVERGLTVAVVPHGGRPGILVNRAAAEAIGMDLDPKLLRLAEVLH